MAGTPAIEGYPVTGERAMNALRKLGDRYPQRRVLITGATSGLGLGREADMVRGNRLFPDRKRNAVAAGAPSP